MTTAFMQAVEQRSATALASGDLLPIITEQVHIQDQGLSFVVRWVSTLAAKDTMAEGTTGSVKDTSKVAMPGGLVIPTSILF